MGIGFGDRLQFLMIDGGDATVGDCQDTVVHHFQWEGMQIDEITGNLQRGDLASAILQNLIAGRKSIQQQRRMIGSASLRYEIFTRGHGSFPSDDRAQELDLRSGKHVVTFEIEKERLDQERLSPRETKAEKR